VSTSSLVLGSGAEARSPWLHSRRWDLVFITASVILVAAPYSIYLGMLKLEPLFQPIASALGTDVSGLSRNLVNYTVALLIGGPHMYVTFTRTALDHGFSARHRRYLLSSLIIPVVVVGLAFLNLTLLLTIFFFWASIHVLHQIVYITELYNEKRKKVVYLRLISRLTDYAVILTALYPLAAWKIAEGDFKIGTNDLGQVVGQFVPVGPWMVWLAGTGFGIALVAWIVNGVVLWRKGELHVPKTLFIGFTVLASFFVPALGNLDTAFQGMNVWHSFQYLALTWLLISLRQRRGELGDSPFVDRLARPGASRRYYRFAFVLTLASVLFSAALFVLLRYGLGQDFNLAFDRAYYIAVLSVLWVHYYLDHYLFTKPQAIAA
jgi:hypothetical protein